MELLNIYFPVAEIETIAIIPPIAAFCISFFVSPAVTSTNFLYNAVGTPGGILRYFREKRMVWPLAACIIAGTLPGVLIGYYLRVRLFPDPKTFKFFVGLVMIFVGYRLIKDLVRYQTKKLPLPLGDFQINSLNATFKTVNFSFLGERIRFSVPAIVFPSLAVGIIGGMYGIGGGAIIAPFLVTVIHLPVYAIAGAVLATRFPFRSRRDTGHV